MTTGAALTATVRADQALEMDPRRWIVLGVVLIGGFMAVVDASILNVAMPSIREDLNATFGDIELVVSAYTLV